MNIFTEDQIKRAVRITQREFAYDHNGVISANVLMAFQQNLNIIYRQDQANTTTPPPQNDLHHNPPTR